MLITLSMGDWSGDGHSQTTDMIIDSNLTRQEIDTAFEEGVKALCFDITEFCVEYEDSSISIEFLDALEKAGFKLWGTKEDCVSLSYREFVKIYLFTVQLGNPKFLWEEVKITTIDIGGYGLFQ